jgi:tetratricopeptide (TPR) repeat protein
MYFKRDYSQPLFGPKRPQRHYGRLFFVTGLLIGGLLLFVSLNFESLQERALDMAGMGPTPTPLPADLATTGIQMAAAGDLQGAAALFERALEQRPNDINYLIEYGNVLLLQENYEAALAVADDALIAAPSDPRGYELKARTQVQSGKPTAAISVALAGLDLGQGFDAPLYAILSRAYTGSGNYEDGVDAGLHAIEIAPDSVEARLAYANALNFFDLRDEALQQIEIAFNLAPNNIQGLFDLAFQYLARDRDQEAIDLYDRILALQPRNARANLWLCRSYKKIGQFDRALGYCRDSASLDDSSPTAFYELGTLYYRNYDFVNALESFRRCAELNPDSLECAYRTGLSYYYVAISPLTDAETRDAYCDQSWTILQDSLVMAQGRFDVDAAIENIRAGLVAVGQDCPNYLGRVVPVPSAEAEATPESTPESEG